jgi:ribonucleoside-diphosphate reductase alpha chain
MMGLVYGDEESLKFTDEVSRILAEIGWQVGIELAKEKGPAPIMDEDFEVTASMLLMRPEMKTSLYCLDEQQPQSQSAGNLVLPNFKLGAVRAVQL